MKFFRKPLLVDLLFVLAMTAFAGFVMTDDLIAKDAAYWDNAYLYSVFWNQMDSLSRFGEPAWWFPANQLGWPAYFYSILGDIGFTKPAGVLLGLFFWLAGRLELRPSIYACYTFHYAFLVPGLFNLAVYALTRQLFTTRTAVLFTVILAAFSPGIVCNISDPGFVEPLAYSLFFVASWIAFLRRPDGSAFWCTALLCAILATTMGYPATLWGPIFIPLAVLLTVVIPRDGYTSLKAALQARPLRQWAIVLAGIATCSLLPILAYSQGGDLVRSTIGTEHYDFRRLMLGNPLEALTVSLPQFGFEWRHSQWTMLQGLQDYHIGVNYIGLLCIPLAAIAVVYAGRPMRLALVIAMTIFSAVICLSAWSPFFSLLIRFVTPLQSNNHYSDLGFRSGAFVIYMLAAGVGIDTLARGHWRARQTFPWLIAGSLALSICVYVAFLGENVLGSSSFGLMLVLSMLMLVLAVWMRRGRFKKLQTMVMVGLVSLTLIDVSSFCFLHMRSTFTMISRMVLTREEIQAKGSVGLAPQGNYVSGDSAEGVLIYRPYFNMLRSGLDLRQMPQYLLFANAHIGGPADAELLGRELQNFVGDAPSHSLVLSSETSQFSEFAPFLAASPESPPKGSVNIIFQSYNDLHLVVESSAPALLFIRDAYSPYWKATVNGDEGRLARALYNFKALVVAKGKSDIHLRFSPPGIGWTLAAAYLVLLSFLALAIREWHSQLRGQKAVANSRLRKAFAQKQVS